MKKFISLTIILFSFSILTSCVGDRESQLKVLESESDKNEVIRVVEDFGDRLKMVSLLAPKEVLEKNMINNYGSLVSNDIINKWIKDPLNAPGRLTSSPWPDRIEIIDIKKISNDIYEVKGKIIEITSKEMTSGGVYAKRPITLVVKRFNNKWIINGVTLDEYE